MLVNLENMAPATDRGTKISTGNEGANSEGDYSESQEDSSIVIGIDDDNSNGDSIPIFLSVPMLSSNGSSHHTRSTHNSSHHNTLFTSSSSHRRNNSSHHNSSSMSSSQQFFLSNHNANSNYNSNNNSYNTISMESIFSEGDDSMDDNCASFANIGCEKAFIHNGYKPNTELSRSFEVEEDLQEECNNEKLDDSFQVPLDSEDIHSMASFEENFVSSSTTTISPFFFHRNNEFQTLQDACLRRIQSHSQPEMILISGESGTGKTILAEQLKYLTSDSKPLESRSNDSISNNVTLSRCSFVRGKFDQLQRYEPYAPILSAMTHWVSTWLQEESDAFLAQKRFILKRAFKSQDMDVLTRMIPVLQEVMLMSPAKTTSSTATMSVTTIGTTTPFSKALSASLRSYSRESESSTAQDGRGAPVSSSMLRGMDANERFHNIIKKFLRVCTNSTPISLKRDGPSSFKEHRSGRRQEKQDASLSSSPSVQSLNIPLILLIDDLQWADAASLELLEAMVSDPDNHGLILIGTCRSNEVSIQDVLAKSLRRLEDEKSTTITNIPLRPLKELETRQLLEDSILPSLLLNNYDFHQINQANELDPNIVKKIFDKTKGNIFFIVKYINELYEADVLVPIIPQVTHLAGFSESHRCQVRYHLNTLGDRAKGNPNAVTWVWNQASLERPENLDLNDIHDIISLTARKIHRMPLICQRVLSVCACIGNADIDEYLLSKLHGFISSIQKQPTQPDQAGSGSHSTDSGSGLKEGLLDVSDILLECERGGILVSSSRQDCSGGSSIQYRFLHDKIQQAAYKLIESSEDLPIIHLNISRILFESLTDFELDGYIFLVIDQWIRGNTDITNRTDEKLKKFDDRYSSSCCNETTTTATVTSSTISSGASIGFDPITENEKCNIANLCLQAGEKSMHFNDFKTALMYFEYGISLLDQQRSWRRGEYNLILNLYNNLAEASCCDSNFDRATTVSQAIIDNGRCLDDKLRGYTSMIYALGAQMKLSASIDLGLQVIRTLGEKIPSRPGAVSIVSSIMKTKFMLRKFRSNGDILQLPDISKTRILNVLSIMNLLITSSVLGRPELFPILACRMVALSLKHGLSALASRAFSVYSLVLIVMGEYDQAHRFNRASLSILDRYRPVRREWISRIYVVSYGFIEHWKEPIHTTYDKLKEAYQTGLECGDTEFSYVAMTMMYQNHLMYGEPLVEYEGKIRSMIREMRACNQRVSTEMTLLSHETALLLMGKYDDPVLVHGAILNLDKATSPKLQQITNQEGLDFNFYYCTAVCLRMIAEYHLGNFDIVLELGKKGKMIHEALPGSSCCRFYLFYYGMAALALINNRSIELTKRKRRKLLNSAKKRIAKIQIHEQHCHPNNRAQLLLLEGEWERAKGRGHVEAAVQKYQEAAHHCAIMQVHRKSFCNFFALAVELQAKSRSMMNNFPAETIYCLQEKTIELYEEWGATAKVELLKKEYDMIDV